jgi:hypothetical protein
MIVLDGYMVLSGKTLKGAFGFKRVFGQSRCLRVDKVKS